ncbi:hypothetical protein ACWDR9_01190 [Streptosporangium sandarakinum]|uniref:hypothetical protein n=1 Tax=Streptosporangium sandarakinum TaxID=1260955 RepID=UPI0036AED577
MPPAPMPGLPFTPVEFDHVTVTPYVNGTGRLAYSIKVREVRAPRTGAAPAKNTVTPAKDVA